MYMHKDIESWNLCTNIYCSDLNKKLKFTKDYINYTGPSFIDSYDFFIKTHNLVCILTITKLLSYKEFLSKNSIIKDIYGVKITYNKIDQRTLINLIQYYLILNEYYIYNDNIYEKIKESKISYRYLGKLVDILYEKFQENIIQYFIKNFDGYFKGFDFSYLMDVYFVKNKNIIESIKDISIQRIEPNFGLIEFNDGIYSIKYDRFFSNKDFYIFPNNLSTIKYYNKSYNWVRKNKPVNWINGLKNALNIKNNELVNDDYIRLCFHIVNPIHKNIFDKKSTLFIYGQSNTGKTTLITNVLGDYFGSENIGSIISAKNFK